MSDEIKIGDIVSVISKEDMFPSGLLVEDMMEENGEKFIKVEGYTSWFNINKFRKLEKIVGNIVVLPCKVDDWIYHIGEGRYKCIGFRYLYQRPFAKDGWVVEIETEDTLRQGAFSFDDFGKKIFLKEEDAIKAREEHYRNVAEKHKQFENNLKNEITNEEEDPNYSDRWFKYLVESDELRCRKCHSISCTYEDREKKKCPDCGYSDKEHQNNIKKGD